MANKRPRKNRRAPSRGDLEALALVLFGAFLFLAASLWPEPPYSGALGRLVKDALVETLGLVAWLLPLPFAYGVYAALRRVPLRRYLEKTLAGLLAALLLLPLVAALAPELAGRVGREGHDRLVGALGGLGLLLPLLAALVLLERLADRPPFSTLRALAAGTRRVLAGLGERARARRVRRRLRAEARALLAEVEELGRRYPEHRLLTELRDELRTRLRRPLTGERLDELAELLSEFREERARELAAQIRAEPPPWRDELEAAGRELEAPLAPENPLLKELAARRRALVLELRRLEAEARRLERAADEALARLPENLEREARAHDERLAAWERLGEQWRDLAERLANWRAWLDWARQVPPEALEAGVKLLEGEGLAAPPPRLAGTGGERAAPEPEPEPKPAPPARTAPPPASAPPPAPGKLALPTPDLLDPPPKDPRDPRALEAEAAERAEVINRTLAQFGLQARVVAWARGPAVTRYEIEPAPGEKIARIQSLANDLARALAVGVVRIEAPIPGKSVIGLEVPNAERELVRFSEALLDPSYRRTRAKLPLILGKSIEGEFWVKDLAQMPHLLIAGSTGSGKSVAINALVMSLLFKYLPTELRLLMIDPKMVELTPYEGIPHLVRGVVTNPADAAGVLLGAVAHMERRYRMMSKVGVRSLEQYNKKMREAGEPTLPYLVIVIDELADLMITSPKEVEQAILRLAQMARATGMHLILATQRPSVDILTSLIKVNIPARIAFAVSSSHDSRTILDATGAERLTGQGDMLFYQPGLAKPVRLQGPYLSDAEIHRVTGYLRGQPFDDAFVERYGADFDGPGLFSPTGEATQTAPGAKLDFSDPLLEAAARIVVEEGQGSVSRLQRRLSIGHARAGKLMDLLEAMGIVGPHQGSKPREVLVTEDQLDEFFGKPH